MWMQNIAHCEPWACYSRLLCSSLHQNTQTHTLAGKSLKVTRKLVFMLPKKLIQFDKRSTPAHTEYTQWLLSIPYSVKLLPSLQWMAAFRNTRKCGIPWSTQERHSFLQRFSWGQKTQLSFMELNTYNLSNSRLFLKLTLGIQPNFYKSENGKLKKKKNHIHTNTHINIHTKWTYPNCYLVNEFLNFYLLKSNI
jgi:hypothetical protein